MPPIRLPGASGEPGARPSRSLPFGPEAGDPGGRGPVRAVVIGGGVIGLCSAYSLAKKGVEVTVVDPGEGPSTSTVNAGMIVPSHIIPLAAPGMIGVGLRMMLRPRSPFWIRPRLDRELIRWGLRFA